MKVRGAHVAMAAGYLLLVLGILLLVLGRPMPAMPLFIVAYLLIVLSAVTAIWTTPLPKWGRREVASERCGFSWTHGQTEVDRQWVWRDREQDARNHQRAQEWANRSRYMQEV